MSQAERKPHKYAEVIKAWADGKDVQYKHEDKKEWIDYISGTGLGFQSTGFLWRVKPELKPAGDVLYDCYKESVNLWSKRTYSNKGVWQSCAEAFIRELKADNIKED